MRERPARVGHGRRRTVPDDSETWGDGGGCGGGCCEATRPFTGHQLFHPGSNDQRSFSGGIRRVATVFPAGATDTPASIATGQFHHLRQATSNGSPIPSHRSTWPAVLK